MQKSGDAQISWLQRLPYYSGLALLAYMPFHVFLSQSLSLVTGGLNEWKIAKDILTGLLAITTLCLVWRKRAAAKEFNWLVGLGLGYFALHLLEWALHPHLYRTSALLGILYNDRVITYAVIGYGAALLLGKRLRMRLVLRFVIAISATVSLLGVVQSFLPSDVLTHLGYSLARGVRPNFFIDNNAHYPRIIATLRDPNSLGAYLILPMTILWSELLYTPDKRRRTLSALLLALQTTALLLTFSRSAWIAAVVAFALVAWWRYHVVATRFAQRWWPLLVVTIALCGVGIFASRHSAFVKGYVIHSTGKPQAQYDSDGFHWYFVKRGSLGIWHDPFGHGPGTAGLVSIQNPTGSFLTENYYVQIGYEVGVQGLLLFLTINVLLYVWIGRRHDPIGHIMLATFWAYVVTNMLLHMWSDEAVACQWWLLAGLAAGQVPKRLKHS